MEQIYLGKQLSELKYTLFIKNKLLDQSYELNMC